MKKYIVVGVIGLLAVGAIAGLIAFTTLTDGTEKFSGAQKQAAVLALEKDKASHPNVNAGLKAHVSGVNPVPAGQVQCTNEPDNPYYYTVTIQRVWFVGYKSTTYSLCDSYED